MGCNILINGTDYEVTKAWDNQEVIWAANKYL